MRTFGWTAREYYDTPEYIIECARELIVEENERIKAARGKKEDDYDFVQDEEGKEVTRFKVPEEERDKPVKTVRKDGTVEKRRPTTAGEEAFFAVMGVPPRRKKAQDDQS